MSVDYFLWKGPNLTNSLVETLLRFRLHRIALTADNKNTFLLVKIEDDNRRYLRVHYLRNPEDEDQGAGLLAVCHLNVNVFESRASSSILAAVLQPQPH